MNDIYLVKYSGTFGFIKPWTAVRDSETFSQQFLTPSIVAGIERKLFPELLTDDDGEIHHIVGHRLSYRQISQQQEVTQTRGWNKVRKGLHRDRSILTRGVMVEPELWLAFDTEEHAQRAAKQHICLCRNEDILLPSAEITTTTRSVFDTDEEQYAGFELLFGEGEGAFLVGYNRFRQSAPMYGTIHIVGTPVKQHYE